MKSLLGKRWAVALLSAGGAAGLAAAAWAATDHDQKKREMKVVVVGEEGSRLEVDDLGELEVGESRSYPLESGGSAFVTRDEKGYDVELDGKKIRIGDGAEGLFEDGERMKLHRIELDGDGHAQAFVLGDGAEHDVMAFHGKDGKHGFAFEKRAGPPGLMFEGLIDRLAENEKFQSLDDATQDLVREAIRESAPKMRWMSLAGPPGEGADKVIIHERLKRSDEKED